MQILLSFHVLEYNLILYTNLVPDVTDLIFGRDLELDVVPVGIEQRDLETGPVNHGCLTVTHPQIFPRVVV